MWENGKYEIYGKLICREQHTITFQNMRIIKSSLQPSSALLHILKWPAKITLHCVLKIMVQINCPLKTFIHTTKSIIGHGHRTANLKRTLLASRWHSYCMSPSSILMASEPGEGSILLFALVLLLLPSGKLWFAALPSANSFLVHRYPSFQPTGAVYACI